MAKLRSLLAAILAFASCITKLFDVNALALNAKLCGRMLPRPSIRLQRTDKVKRCRTGVNGRSKSGRQNQR